MSAIVTASGSAGLEDTLLGLFHQDPALVRQVSGEFLDELELPAIAYLSDDERQTLIHRIHDAQEQGGNNGAKA